MVTQARTKAGRVAAPRRISGGKRGLEEAQSTDNINHVDETSYVLVTDATTTHKALATDVVNSVPGSDATTTQPPAKKKVTYALPHQNMEEGHLYVILGEDIDVSTQRFKILSLLGEGTFGKVVEAWDRKRKEYCAVKIIRNLPKYSRDAAYEIRFMQSILDHDPTDRRNMSRLLRCFETDTRHVCIVMPKYGPSMLDQLQKRGPLPYRHIAEIVFHVCASLDFLHSKMRLIHTDLKPENILFEGSELESVHASVLPGNNMQQRNPFAWNEQVPALPCKVRLCDLGGCCDERHSSSAIVSTRHYRSPEVILGLGWMFSTDMWSMGCIIYELATGRLLYDTHDNLEHLHLMEKTLARLPAEWAKNCSSECKGMFLTSSGQRLKQLPASSVGKVSRTRSIHDMIGDKDLRELIFGCLSYDRSKRLTAREVMAHPFISTHFPESLGHPNHPKRQPDLPPVPIG